jgi:hypothetical protein
LRSMKKEWRLIAVHANPWFDRHFAVRPESPSY